MICKLCVCICGCVFWIYLYSDWFDSIIILGLRLSVTVSYSLYSVWVWNHCTWTHIFPISHFSLQTFPIHTLKSRLLLITWSLAILTPPVTISRSTQDQIPVLWPAIRNHNHDFHSWSLLTSSDCCHSSRWALCKWFDFGLVLLKRCDCNLVKARVLSHHEIEVGVWARVQFALSLCQTICMDQREAQTFTERPILLEFIFN